MTARGAAGIRHPYPEPPAPGEATEVAEGVLWIRLPLPMALDHVNVYALDDGGGWTVIDAGIGSRKTFALWEGLMAGPLAGRHIHRVLVTHHHPDHVGAAGWLKSRHGAELVTTRTAWLFARMLQLDEQPLPAPETVAFWRGAGMAPDLLARRMEERPFNFADTVAPLPLGFTRIREGDRLSIGGRGWTVRIGNGHAPEHATLWSDDGIVIAGDQLLPAISPNIGTYATEPEADPLADWIEACDRLSAFATDDQLVLPGHKLPYHGLPHRIAQLAENHQGALERLRGFLAGPRTAVDCFQPLFLRDIREGEYALALVEAMSHVLHLWHRGEVLRTRREDGAWLWQRKD